MIFQETVIPGAFVLTPEFKSDDRGFFARMWCEREFSEHGLNPRVVQTSVSYNRRRGTTRGLHYQASPHAEAKLIRCTRGAIYDVLVDVRPDSPTFRQWIAVTLTADNHDAVYAPEGVAHGFQTLEDNTEVSYQMSHEHVAHAERGARFDDPAFAIEWPAIDLRVISQRDLHWPLFALPSLTR